MILSLILGLIAVVIGGILLIALIVDGFSDTTSSQNTTTQQTRPSAPTYTPTYKPTYTPTKSTPEECTITPAAFAQKLDTLTDAGDVQEHQTTEEQRRLVADAKTYQKATRRSYTKASTGEVIHIDLSWSENLAELLEKTGVVYSNAEMQCHCRLNSERFDYYIRLHYRSFTAANLCYAKRQELLPHERHIREIVSRLQNREDPLRVDTETYHQLVSLRNTLGDLCCLLAKRVEQLNHQTGVLRDKILAECGARGTAWYQRLMERSTNK